MRKLILALAAVYIGLVSPAHAGIRTQDVEEEDNSAVKCSQDPNQGLESVLSQMDMDYPDGDVDLDVLMKALDDYEISTRPSLITAFNLDRVFDEIAQARTFVNSAYYMLINFHTQLKPEHIDRIIDKMLLENTEDGYYGFNDLDPGFYLVEMLERGRQGVISLSEQQKQRVVAGILDYGNDLDARYLLDNFKDTMSEEQKQQAKKNTASRGYLSRLTSARHITEMKEGLPEISFVKFIVHPFYSQFFENDAGPDGISLEKMKTQIYYHLDSQTYSYEFRDALLQHNQAVSFSQSFPDQAVVLVLPRYMPSTDIETCRDDYHEQHEAFVRFLNEELAGRTDVYYMESGSSGAGTVSFADFVVLGQRIPDSLGVHIEGNYLTRCMLGAARRLVLLANQTTIDLSNCTTPENRGIDFTPSTDSLIFQDSMYKSLGLIFENALKELRALNPGVYTDTSSEIIIP